MFQGENGHKFLRQRYEELKRQNLSLDISRGKPSVEQLNLSNILLERLDQGPILPGGLDIRNYSNVDGIPHIKELGSWLLGIDESKVMAFGNSSLLLMFQYLLYVSRFGIQGPESAWLNDKNATVLCPVPGYDRHFSMCEELGLKMIPVPMLSGGPDMNMVEDLVKDNPSIKGIICVPKHSNPTGHTYSDSVVERLAALKPSAEHFRIIWDNAYAVHDFSFPGEKLRNVMNSAVPLGREDQPVLFGSTSKITFPGSGISFMGGSPLNLKSFKRFLSIQTVGSDKIKQFRHSLMFPTKDALSAHMEEHAKLMRPRFRAVESILKENLDGKNCGTWNQPKGGYFISFNTRPGFAKKTVQLAQECGVKVTPAGATFPYGKDPLDQNIRIAPSCPPFGEIKKGIEIFAICVELAHME